MNVGSRSESSVNKRMMCLFWWCIWMGNGVLSYNRALMGQDGISLPVLQMKQRTEERKHDAFDMMPNSG